MQRPKPGGTEEDLLKLQTEFLKSKDAPSVSITRSNRDGNKEQTANEPHRDVVKMEGMESSEISSSSIPSKKSQFHLQGNVKPETTSTASTEGMGDEELEEMMDRKETGLAAVLTTIIERDTRNEMISAPILGSQAFPRVLQNENLEQNPAFQPHTSTRKTKKKSLFAQHIEAKTAKEFGVDRAAFTNVVAATKFASQNIEVPTASVGPCIIDGKGLSASNCGSEANQIHEENLDRLRSMSNDEIIEQQQKLLETIDPKLVSYLKRKRQEKETDGAKRTCDHDSTQTTSFSVEKVKRSQQMLKKESKTSIPIKPEKNWVHMDVLEKDKMEWMSELPPPSSVSSETGNPARFDFEGNLLAVDEDISVREGLHHHGDEPERAGYTLQELFILARSSNLQQRILSLHTLAKIIRKAKCGNLSKKTEGPIIPVLLDGGLVLLLRWSLDDSVEVVVYAAVDALHALLWSRLDEEAVDLQWPAYLGHIDVALTPNVTLEKWALPADLDEENKEEETDADVMKRDIIEALVRRTHILTRFEFILESMKPQAPVVVKMLSILCRVAQHSGTMAYEIMKCSRLMDGIVKKFLPTAWPIQDPTTSISNVYGLPVSCALRLIRCLAQTGRNITATLIAKYHLSAILLRYLSAEVRTMNLPVVEASNLQKEALVLWRVFASYGLSTQTFFDMYEVIVRKIGKIGQSWSSSMQEMDYDQHYHKASLVSLLEKMVCGTTSGNLQGLDKDSILTNMPLGWSHVTNLFQPIRTFASESLKTVGETYPVEKQDLMLPTACLNFLASFYDAESKQSGLDQVARLEELESLCTECLLPFMSSYGLNLMREYLCPFSNLLTSSWKPPKEITSSLPSRSASYEITSDLDDSKGLETLNVPILRPHSPFAFLVSLYRLVLSVCKRHKALITRVLPLMVDNPDLLLYLKKVCQAPKSPLNSSHWTRQENLLHYYWVKSCTLKPCTNMTLAHRVSLHLLSRLFKGDEFLVHDLMTSVIFSPAFIIEGQDPLLTSEAIASLTLSESLYLKSATQENISFSKNNLLREAYAALATIRGHYIMALSGMEQAVIESRYLHTGNVYRVHRQAVDCDGEGLMPQDWVYLPLIHVYNKATQLKSVPGSEITSKDVAMVTSVLQWTYLLQIWRPKEIENTSVTTRLSRVMCAFIAGNDLFLEKGVQKYLAGLFREMTNQKHVKQINPEEKLPGISAFYDLYQEFLEHYESVSFGDPVFGLYLLLPLQQRHNSLYRKAVWGERAKILRTMRVSLRELLIPIENFLQPEETDVELINLYVQALVTGAVQTTWSPVLYLVAVHHVNRFLFISHDDGNVAVRDRFWKIIAANCEKIRNVVYYKNFNASMSDGMEVYEVLPSNRQDLLNKYVENN